MVHSSSRKQTDPLYPRTRTLSWLLRLCGMADCMALVIALWPDSWLIQSHASLGQGAFPQEPIAFYLARSASLMYAAHGALLFFLSFHVLRYSGVIRFLGWLALLHGILLIIIEIRVGMPWWWTWSEGPLLLCWGSLVLLLESTVRHEAGREAGETG